MRREAREEEPGRTSPLLVLQTDDSRPSLYSTALPGRHSSLSATRPPLGHRVVKTRDVEGKR